LADLAVFVEEFGKLQFGSVRRESGDVHLHGLAFGKTAHEFAQILLEPAHHDIVQSALEHLDAACEALRIEQFQQRAETVGMAVVRCCGKKKTMFEARGEFADCFGYFGINGVFRAA